MMSSTVDPYASGKITTNLYAKKRDVQGPLVVVLDGKLDNRDLSLIAPMSRCLCRGQVHELILTDEAAAKPGTRVQRIAYLGFFAVEQEGVIVSGDELLLNGKLIGHLAGFDETHMPNHLNIVIRTDKRLTGVELEGNPGMSVVFHQPVPGHS